MSNFYPFNLNMRAGPSDAAPITTPDTGCPLNDHPLWERVIGAGDSVLCWENKNGTSISVHGSDTTIKNLAFMNQFYVDGTVGCTIDYVPPGDKNWLLPLAARMINGNNLLGARWNDGKFEIVQRVNGVWATKGSGGTPVVGDEVIFTVSGRFWKLIVNGLVLLEGTHNVANTPGYWGISQHRSDDLDGNTILSNFNAVSNAASKTPCMTGNYAPYGEMWASSNAEEAWKGMNCNFDDGWRSDDGVILPQQITWLGPPNQPKMVPDRLIYTSLTTGGETDHGPETMTLIGTNDGVTWDDIQTWSGLDFGPVPDWEFVVPGDIPYRGIGLRVDNIRATGTYCQLGDFRVYGHVGELKQESGAAWMARHFERTNDGVYLKDIGATGNSDDKAQLFSGTALHFDGLDDEININLDEYVNTYTIALTGKTTSEGGVLFIPSEIIIALDSTDGFRFYTYAEDDPQYRQIATDITQIARYVITVDIPNSTIRIYKDKILELEDTNVSFGPSEQMFDLVILGRFFEENFFEGELSNIQIWKTLFDQNDINYDFENPEKIAHTRENTLLDVDDLLGYWPLCEGSGHLAHDWSDNARHGILIGFPNDDTQWIDQISSPLVPQTMLMGWGLGTNLLLQSNNFLIDPWTSYDAIITEEGSLNIFGDKWFTITDENVSTTANARQEVILDAGAYTFSVIVKKGSSEIFTVAIYDQTDANYVSRINFIWIGDNLEVDFESIGTGYIQNIGNGEWRVFVTTATSLIDGNAFRLFLMPSEIGIQADHFQHFSSAKLFFTGEIPSYVVTSDEIAINCLTPLHPWERNSQFRLGNAPLNFNGRSYADAANEEDVNANTTLIMEYVGKAVDKDPHYAMRKEGTFTFGDRSDGHYANCYQTSGNTSYTVADIGLYGKLNHNIYVFDTHKLKSFANKIQLADETCQFDGEPLATPDFPFFIGKSADTYYKGKIQALAIYKDQDAQDIIDNGIETWIEERYKIANRLYALDALNPGFIQDWVGKVNISFTAEGPYWKVTSDDPDYSLHIWDGQVIPVEEGETYIMRWFAKLGKYDVANYATFDVTNNFFIHNNVNYAMDLNHANMTMIEVDVLIPAGCTELAISPFRGTDGPAEIILHPIVNFFKKEV